MHCRWTFLLLLLLLRVSFLVGQALLNTTSGVYVGRTIEYRQRTVRQYLGIEYARVTERFSRAEPIRRQNQSLIDATAFGQVCKSSGSVCSSNASTTSCSVEYGIFAFKSISVEQCLFLNVFLPSTLTGEKKPVLMWIHGGSGQIGSGSVFDGTMLAAVGDIIVVTFNFRLNLFGFLSAGDERLEGNVGLYDQSLVLEWIFENSEALGADPQRLTIGGHSAGAPHAYSLAVSPLSRGRVRRVLLQSGCPLNIWSFIRPNQAMERFQAVADENNCSKGHETFDDQLQCLRQREFHLLVERDHFAYTSANHTNLVLHGDFREAVTDGALDMLIGSTDDEGIYVSIVPLLIEQVNQEILTLNTVNFTDIARKFLVAMQPEKSCLHQQALDLYDIHPLDLSCSQRVDCYCSSFYNYSRLISDVLFYNDYYRFLQQRLTRSQGKTFVYRYSHWTSHIHPTVCHSYLSRQKIVGHFAELEYTWGVPFVFDRTVNHTPLIQYVTYPSRMSTGYTPEELQFTGEMIEQWSNFVKYGQPNSTRFADRWRSLSDGLFMHFRLNQSELQPFRIPSSVQFWNNACPTETPRLDLTNEICRLAVLVGIVMGVLIVFFTF